MTEAVKHVAIRPDSELARALQAASRKGETVAVETGEAVYELAIVCVEPGAMPESMVARSIAGIEQAAGSWKDVDLNAFHAYREERRRLHTRPPIEL